MSEIVNPAVLLGGNLESLAFIYLFIYSFFLLSYDRDITVYVYMIHL